jgi:actin-related protein
MEEAQIIVIENGSSTIKAGFAGEYLPQAVFSNTICYANT